MKFFTSVSKANAELSAADEALKPDLEKAGIATAMREGKSVLIAEATVAEKYLALRAAQPAGTDLQARSELLESNDLISKRCEKAESDLAISQTSVATQTRELADFKADLITAQTGVSVLTSEKADLNNRLQAAINQFTANAREIAGFNGELSKLCVAAGCLELGLAAEATPEQKQAAAEQIPVADKLKAYQGAVNSALARTGVDPGRVPAGGPGSAGQSITQLAISKQYSAITDPIERTRFYRANKDAIDAGYRNPS